MSVTMQVSSEPLIGFDCNLPELLAGDLELQGHVFKSKHLTAGAPAPELADDGSKRRYTMQTSSGPALSLSSQHPDPLSRSKSLQAVDQQYSQLFTYTAEWSRRDSVSSSEFSGGMEPPSVGTRDESVVTGPTAYDSDLQISPTSCDAPSPTQKSAQNSWVDLELEQMAGSSSERRHSMVDMAPTSCHFLHSNLDEDLRSMSLSSVANRANLAQSPTFGSSHLSITSSQRTSIPLSSSATPLIPKRRSSLQHRDLPRRSLKPQFPFPSSMSRPRFKSSHSSTTSPQRPQAQVQQLQIPYQADDELDDRRSHLSLSSDSSLEEDRYDRPAYASGSGSMALNVIPSDVDVEQWLNDSFNFGPQLPSRDQSLLSPLPLSRDILDRIKTTVSQFPDLTFTCSDTPVERIRYQARRLRYADNCFPLDIQPDPPKQTFFSKLINGKTAKPTSLDSYKNGKNSSGTFGSIDKGTGLSPPSWAGVARPDWAAIKNIFQDAPDYYCDALYAYVIIFNYVTALVQQLPCPRPRTQASKTSGKSTTAPDPYDMDFLYDDNLSLRSRASRDDNQIPQKALSFLGMPVTQDLSPPATAATESDRTTAITSTQTLRKMKSNRNFLSIGRGTDVGKFGTRVEPEPNKATYPPSMASAAHRPKSSRRPPTDSKKPSREEQELCELQIGLARCIASLVTTLRVNSQAATAMPNNGAGPSTMASSMDVFFMRALCEVVKGSEER
ncbi:hypothetical protein F5Y15DRAFT_398130 [Xylariaceae sp. FL0016]|nr:hypothetical protein F5Y15DRAFT_398130 [Xylariaceae sp. FL0016]